MTFEALGIDAGPGNYVSRVAVTAARVQLIDDLIEALRAVGVELRVLDRLASLAGVRSTSLHVSGFRLRNAVGGREAVLGSR